MTLTKRPSPFGRRKPFLPSCMAAAVQRKAIEDELRRFTLRVTHRAHHVLDDVVQGSRRLRYAGPHRRRNIALGKPYCSAEFPRRDIIRQHKFPAREIAHARALNRYLAGVKANPLGSAPAG